MILIGVFLVTDLFTCVDTLLEKVDRLADRSFFNEDFAAYPNNENSLELEVCERLEFIEADIDDPEYSQEYRDELLAEKELVDLSKGIVYECVDSYGGEDCGREYYYIWKFTRGEESVVFKFEGWYASHYGSEFENYQEVKPVSKIVVVWE